MDELEQLRDFIKNRCKDSEFLKAYFMQMPWFRKQLALNREIENDIEVFTKEYANAQSKGILIEESDGQFTENIWHETYDTKDGFIHEFVFEEDRPILIRIYDSKKYKGE